MRSAWIVAWLGLAGIGCDGSNPVAPVDLGEPAPATSYTISLTAEPTTVFATVTTKVVITVTVEPNDGGESADSISVSTSLGTFANGDALATESLDASGKGTLELDPGEEPGMAEILARTGDSAGSLTLEIKDPGEQPNADFTFEIDDTTVIFTDMSSGDPEDWAWDFGDLSTSTEQNPVHTYVDRITYQVMLTAFNEAGLKGEITKFVVIEAVPDVPVAAFTFDSPTGLTVKFEDASTPMGDIDSWLWDFGDGETSEVQNPGHLFPSSDTYPVTLEVENTSGRSSTTQLVEVTGEEEPEVEIVAAFSTVRNERTVIFTDESTGDPVEWLWDFGDGNESARQSPIHAYADSASGTDEIYAVSLTATNSAGDSDTSNRFICVNGDPPDTDCPETTGG